MNIIFLGAPGAGKGTCAVRVSEKYAIPHISTGDIFRANIRNNTELGKRAKSFIDKGQLVPDEVVIDIVADRLLKDDCVTGYVLDGFPRTIAQAEALDKAASIDIVINLVVADDVIITRLAGRRACGCGNTSHVSWLNDGITCPKCGMEMYQREDDKEETVKNRLNVYYAETSPLIGYYTKKGNLVNVDGSSGVDNVIEEVYKVLSKI